MGSVSMSDTYWQALRETSHYHRYSMMSSATHDIFVTTYLDWSIKLCLHLLIRRSVLCFAKNIYFNITKKFTDHLHERSLHCNVLPDEVLVARVRSFIEVVPSECFDIRICFDSIFIFSSVNLFSIDIDDEVNLFKIIIINKPLLLTFPSLDIC